MNRTVTKRPTRSISLPISLGIVAVVLSIALLVGWILVIVASWDLVFGAIAGTWLMVAGIISLAFISIILILFSIFLVREILETRHQAGFIDSVTHELKSPLASLKLGLETLNRPQLTDEQRRDVFEMMHDDVDRLSVFIDDILVASRLPFERRGHTVKEVQLRELLRQHIDFLVRRHKIEADAITLEVPDDLKITTDSAALSTAVKNLIDNAIKYSDAPRIIRVRADSDAKDGIRISITDNGIGFAPTERKRIFERFYRAGDESVRTRRGTGLGLFVAHTLIRRMGGRIEAHSEGPGRGATLTIRLRSRGADARGSDPDT